MYNHIPREMAMLAIKETELELRGAIDFCRQHKILMKRSNYDVDLTLLVVVRNWVNDHASSGGFVDVLELMGFIGAWLAENVDSKAMKSIDEYTCHRLYCRMAGVVFER